jgi:hypothetical protein
MPATQADSALEYVLFGLRILLAIALYAFLAVLLWALLRERSSEKTAHSPTAWLEEDTPDQLADNHRYVLRSGTWIGRDPSCPVCVNDELVSERHAYIGWRADEQAWYIEDNFSKNGTFVNGQRIQHALLDDGDVVQIGRRRLIFLQHPAQSKGDLPMPPQALSGARRP